MTTRTNTIREALRTLVTADEWYEWLWGEDTPPDRGTPPPTTEGAREHTT